ncbi:hypothetical protein CLOSTMETH_02903 [[Clostridium] methylpentosum DSM 5476]|uniref:Uncharacterized protein n=1 Tax=[Clostridium] methylpentosum DSM 5476 TaxID=537013 RepID=C0EGB0_9FIRM|nr:hypothetical protein CLOSTMETH_02903 [[Clostridium] methylpentosum DSM 5476]
MCEKLGKGYPLSQRVDFVDLSAGIVPAFVLCSRQNFSTEYTWNTEGEANTQNADKALQRYTAQIKIWHMTKLSCTPFENVVKWGQHRRSRVSTEKQLMLLNQQQ